MIATSIPAGLSPKTYPQRSVSGRDLISIQDFTPDELACTLELAAAMKARSGLVIQALWPASRLFCSSRSLRCAPA